MNIKQMLSTEISYNENLKNKIIMQIPKTPYHVSITYVPKTEEYDVHILQLMSSKRKRVAKGVSRKKASALCDQILKNKDKVVFKGVIKFKDMHRKLLELLTSIIKKYE